MRGMVVTKASERKEALKETMAILASDHTVSLTLDLWTNRQLLSYMGVTVHFVNFHKLEAHLLTFRRFPEGHNAENIVACFETIMDENNLANNVSMVVTDSASNMLKATGRLPCSRRSK